MIKYVKELIEYVDSLDNLYLFGSGAWAERYWSMLSSIGLDLDGCIVSDRKDNPLVFHNKSVYSFDELSKSGLKPEDINLMIALKDGSMDKWLEYFHAVPKFKSVLYIQEPLQKDFDMWHGRFVLKEEYEKAHTEYSLELYYPGGEKDIGVLIEKKTGRGLFRMPSYRGDWIIKECIEYCDRKQFEDTYGRLILLPIVDRMDMSDEMIKKAGLEIYVVTSHVDRISGELSLYPGEIPIQAGAALTTYRSRIITDDTGQNISDRNRDYSECTAMYWIWKNTSGADYVGLSHYRRRIKLNDNALRFIIDEDIDIVPTLPQFDSATVKDFFLGFIEEYDWSLLKQFIVGYDPEYEAVYNEYENCHFYYPCNVFLWKREWFERYCEFSFTVTDRIYEYYRRAGAVREDRYIGYLFEQLSSLFIIRHKNELKVACAEMHWVR